MTLIKYLIKIIRVQLHLSKIFNFLQGFMMDSMIPYVPIPVSYGILLIFEK